MATRPSDSQAVSEQRVHGLHEGGNSPQPQIRIRKETQKVKPSNDLAQFEENLL